MHTARQSVSHGIGLVIAIAILGIVATLIGCSQAAPRTIPPADAALLGERDAWAALDAAHTADIASVDEPGRRLTCLCTLVHAVTGDPLADTSIQIYHANTGGEYDEATPGDESTARLNATVRTDSHGRVLIRTILPGDYGSTADNRHIHTTIAAGTPAYYDIYFEPYINPGLRDWAIGSSQAVIANLHHTGDDALLCTATLPVRFADTTQD